MAVASPPPYLRPASLAEALDALAASPRLVVAGGTDVYPARTTRPVTEDVLDISRVDGLRGITSLPGGAWRFGATTTWTDIASAAYLPPAFDGLRAAARQVGGRQIQNAGTIAGNLVNGSPAADGTPILLALGAVVECTSAARGVRRVPLAAFATGYRATALAPDELVTAVEVPGFGAAGADGADGAAARSTFLKLGSRAYLVISIVSVAAVLVAREGLLTDARLAVGACSPVPVRLRELEAALVGRRVSRELAGVVVPDHLAALTPIDDVRAPAPYRLDAALTLVRRALAEVAR